MCELCERVLCVSYIRKQIGGQLRPTRQVCRKKFVRGQHGRQRERKFCVRALPASSAGRQIGGQLRPTRQVRRNIFFRGQHGRQRERKFCVRALPASSAGRQIGRQLRPTRQVCRKNMFLGPRKTTRAQVLCASSACQFCWQRDATHINPSQHKFAFQKELAARPPRRRRNIGHCLISLRKAAGHNGTQMGHKSLQPPGAATGDQSIQCRQNP